MNILFLNYLESSPAPMIRSLELANATSNCGHHVSLCFMHPCFSPPVYFYELIKNYQRKNFKILYTPPSSLDKKKRNNLHSNLITSRLTLIRILKQSFCSLKNIPKELTLFNKLKPDVIVARPDLVMSFFFSCKILRIPLVLETDGPVEEFDYYWGVSSWWLRGFDTFRAKRVQALLYISKTCGKLWLNKKIPKEHLFLCPNGADPKFFTPISEKKRYDFRKKNGLEQSTVLAFSGNQRNWHGVNDLLKASMPMLIENKSLKILIIGTLQDKKSLLLKEIPKDILKKQIIFTGTINYSDIPKFIDLADIMVMPYPFLELFHFSPMKMFEALSMAKIIVASKQGQIIDICSSLESVFLYNPVDKNGLSDALKKALNALKIKKSASDARQLIIEKHSWLHRGKVIEDACNFAMK